MIASLSNQDDYMITFNLKLGYHHVDINVDSWPYPGKILVSIGSISCFEFSPLD